jgi:hypothetical protein
MRDSSRPGYFPLRDLQIADSSATMTFWMEFILFVEEELGRMYLCRPHSSLFGNLPRIHFSDCGSWPEISTMAEGEQKWILECLLKIEK